MARKPKHKDRTMLQAPRRAPSGRLSRADQTPEFSPALVRRLREAAVAGMAAPEWGSEVGRLFLCYSITEAQYEAAKRLRQLVADYWKAIGTMPPYPKTGALEIGMGRSPEQTDEHHTRKDRATIARMEAAYQALGPLRIAVCSVVCDDTLVFAFDLPKLKTGLTILEHLWGLTKRHQ
jgi:hypothetical protein